MRGIPVLVAALLAAGAVIYLFFGEEFGIGTGGAAGAGYTDAEYGDDLSGVRGLTSRGTGPSPEEEDARAAAEAARRAQPTFDRSQGTFGVVQDGRGHPIANATVKLIAIPKDRLLRFDLPDPAPVATAKTDEQGNYLVGPMALGQRYRVRGEAAGFAPSLQMVKRPGTRVDLILDGGGALDVRVVDHEGTAIAGADVTHQSTQWPNAQTVVTTLKTGADGMARFPALPTGTGSLLVVAAEHAVVRIADVGVAPRETETRTIVLEAGPYLDGLVIAAEGELPLEGAQIHVHYPNFPYIEPTGPVTTGMDGRFRIQVRATAPEQIQIRVDHVDYAQARVQRNAPGSGWAAGDVTIKMTKGGDPLQGRVVGPDGRGAGGVTVTYAWMAAEENVPETTSGSDGDFELPLPEWAGSNGWSLLAISPNDGIAQTWAPRPKKDAARPVLQLQLGGAGALAGKVTDRTGAPVQGALVSATIDAAATQKLRPGRQGRGWQQAWNLTNLLNNDARFDTTAVTGADGTYVISGLPAVAYQVSARFGLAQSRAEEPVLVEAGETATADVTLGEGGTIAGTVVDSEDRPVAGANIWAQPTQQRGFGWWIGMPTARSGSDGRFVLRGVADGTFNLSANASGYGQGSEKNVARGVTDVTLRMRPLGWIEGIVTVDGTPHNGTFTVFANKGQGPGAGNSITAPNLASSRWVGNNQRQQVFNTNDGRFKLRGLPAGDWTVWANTKEGLIALQREVVTVYEGRGSREITLALTRGAVLTGRVTSDVTGEALANAAVSVSARKGASGDQSGATPAGTRTDREGQYTIEGVGTGSYVVTVYTADGLWWTVPMDLQAGERRTLDLRQQPPGTIQVTVVDEAGVAVAGARPQVRSDLGTFVNPNWRMLRKDGLVGNDPNAWRKLQATDEAGVNVRYHIAPGRYRVTASLKGYAMADEGTWVVVGPGATAVAHVVLKKTDASPPR